MCALDQDNHSALFVRSNVLTVIKYFEIQIVNVFYVNPPCLRLAKCPASTFYARRFLAAPFSGWALLRPVLFPAGLCSAFPADFSCAFAPFRPAATRTY